MNTKRVKNSAQKCRVNNPTSVEYAPLKSGICIVVLSLMVTFSFGKNNTAKGGTPNGNGHGTTDSNPGLAIGNAWGTADSTHPGKAHENNNGKKAKVIVLQNDLNYDGIVDIEDVVVYSTRYLRRDWEDINWCGWMQNEKKKTTYRENLVEIVQYYFQCPETVPGEPPLLIKHENKFPVRMSRGLNGQLMVSDSKANSVFIYNADFSLFGELKGLFNPLGVAVDGNGNIYVGNDGSNNVEVYSAEGIKIRTLGRGKIRMPNDLVLDGNNNLYVVDSRKNTVWVFAENGDLIRSIGCAGDGKAEFKFPVSVAIDFYLNGATGLETGELYVADQGHSLIKVFDLEGNYLRSFGGLPSSGGGGMFGGFGGMGMFGGFGGGSTNENAGWEGKFMSLQDLEFDESGRLHVLDNFTFKIQILNPVNGRYISHYGEVGTAEGQLKLPLDLLTIGMDDVIVANHGNRRIEMISILP